MSMITHGDEDFLNWRSYSQFKTSVEEETGRNIYQQVKKRRSLQKRHIDHRKLIRQRNVRQVERTFYTFYIEA